MNADQAAQAAQLPRRIIKVQEINLKLQFSNIFCDAGEHMFVDIEVLLALTMGP